MRTTVVLRLSARADEMLTKMMRNAGPARRTTRAAVVGAVLGEYLRTTSGIELTYAFDACIERRLSLDGHQVAAVAAKHKDVNAQMSGMFEAFSAARSGKSKSPVEELTFIMAAPVEFDQRHVVIAGNMADYLGMEKPDIEVRMCREDVAKKVGHSRFKQSAVVGGTRYAVDETARPGEWKINVSGGVPGGAR